MHRILRLRRPPPPMRKPFRGNPPNKFVVSLMLTTILAVISLVYLNIKITPFAIEIGMSKAVYMTGIAITDAINEQVSEDNVTYNDLIDFEKNGNGEITALKTNMQEINLLRAKISARLLDKINDMDMADCSIPIGNLTGIDLFSGRGPRIPVRFIPVGTVRTSFKNEFTAAGINQTRHRIVLDVAVDINILITGRYTSETVTSEVSIAETVLVGDVPQYYASIGNSDSGLVNFPGPE